MRPRLLLLLAAAAASKWPEPPDNEVDAYVRSWAAGGTARRCGDVGAHGDCSWMSGFGPIDVACTIHIDRVGLLDDKRGPALTLKFHDGVGFPECRGEFSSPARGRRRLFTARSPNDANTRV